MEAVSDMEHYEYNILGIRVVLKSNVRELRTPLETLYAAFPRGGMPSRRKGRDGFRYAILERNGDRAKPGFGILKGDRMVYETVDREDLLRYLEWFIHGALLDQLTGYYQIHAGVVNGHGTGVILPGPSGSGKTTLVTGLLQMGYQYLSDEVALVDPKTLRVHPFPRRLHVPMADLELFSRRGFQGSEIPMRATKYGAEIQVPIQRVGLPVQAAYVIFPTFAGSGQRPELTPISKGVAVLNLVKSSLNFQRHRGAGVDVLTRLVGKAFCFQLKMGGLKETLSLVSELLERQCPALG